VATKVYRPFEHNISGIQLVSTCIEQQDTPIVSHIIGFDLNKACIRPIFLVVRNPVLIFDFVKNNHNYV
jgi:hypothetical protein